MPHADLGENVLAQKTVPGDTDFQAQTVKFLDTHPGFAVQTESEEDILTKDAFPQDVPLDKFFGRPVRIQDFVWNVNGLTDFEFNPWLAFFTNSRVLARISNYRMMRANLHVKVMVNGTPFHYGRTMMTYNPLPTTDGYTRTRTGIIEDAIAGSQRPHIWIDPTNSQGGELVLPFFWNQDGLDLGTARFQDLGVINLITTNTLQHALGKSSPVHITVYAWATDLKLSIPTQVDVGAVSPQAEYSKGPVSRAATAAASAAQLFTEAPVIGKFMKATEIAASSAAQISSLYGYSNPPQLETNNVRPVLKSNLATSSGLDEVTKLTLDPKSETTLDTRLLGLKGDDEMVITAVACRESYLTTFPWNIAAGDNTRLFSIVVDPCVRAMRSEEMHFPACCFATMPFKYWRGSLKYRFQVVCSKYHKGRLAITWDPVSDISSTVNFETNTNYTTIVDISDTTDFTIEVGWGQTTPYREHFPVFFANSETPVSQSAMFANAALNYVSSSVDYGNGVLSVYVLNELSVPDNTVDANISVNVLVSAGDDFQVSAPCSTYLNMIRTTNASEPKDIITVEPEPQAEIVSSAPPEETQRYDSAPAMSSTVDVLGPTSQNPSRTDLYFGENIVSFRQLLKRYVLSEYISLDVDGLTVGVNVFARCGREAMPAEPMYAVTSKGATLDVIGTGPSLFYYAVMTPMRYLTLGYGGWRGSIRQGILGDLADNSWGALTRNSPTYISWRTGACANYLNASTATDWWWPPDRNQYYGATYDNEGMSGTAVLSPLVNPFVTVEVPYFTPYKFAPAKQLPRFTQDITTAVHDDLAVEPGKTYFEMTRTVRLGLDNNHLPTHARYVAAGEDFNLFYYLGPPVFFATRRNPSAPPA
nr:MAG: structural polyprotein [Salisharnavirus sp.]